VKAAGTLQESPRLQEEIEEGRAAAKRLAGDQGIWRFGLEKADVQMK
jgi:hypothetical protein